MKTHLIIFAIALVCCMAFKAIDTIINKLGMKEDAARNYILRDFVGTFATSPIDDANSDSDGGDEIYRQTKSFQIPNAQLLSTVISGDRKLAAKELCEYVKGYVTSPAFQTDYRQARENARPESEPTALTAEDLESMKQTVKVMEEQYKTLKESKMAPEAALAEFDKSIKDMKAQLAGQGDPTPNKTKWEKLYPEDPSLVVKARLQEYLQILGTVDFNAQVTGTGNNQKFVNTAYEKQSLKWKAIFRAGKDVNEVASSYAKEWLKGPLVSK